MSDQKPLKMKSGHPHQWESGDVLGEELGGTGQTSWTLGDLLYASATDTLSKLTGNASTTRKFLRQTGTGSASAAPAWDTLQLGDLPGALLAPINDFRLSLATGDPAPVADQAAKSVVYLTPFLGNRIAIYDTTNSVWVLRTTTEISITLSSLTSGKPYDVFAYWTGSAVALELSAAWTNDTTPSDALARQDGVWTKSSDHSRRWVGMIYTTGTTTTEDSVTSRYVLSAQNRLPRRLQADITTDNWDQLSASSWELINANINKVNFLSDGVSSVEAKFSCTIRAYNGFRGIIGLSISAETTPNAESTVGNARSDVASSLYEYFPATAVICTQLARGRYYINMLEWANSDSAANVMFTGRNSLGSTVKSGLLGVVWA